MLNKKIYLTFIMILALTFTLSACDFMENGGRDDPSEYTLRVNIIEGSSRIRQDGQRFEDGEVVYLEVVDDGWKISEIDCEDVTKENNNWKVLMDEDREIDVYLELEKYDIETETNLFDHQAHVQVIVSEVPEDYPGDFFDIDPLNPPHGTVIEADARTTNGGTFSRWEEDAIEYGSMNPIYITVEEDLYLRAVFDVGDTIY